MQLSTESISTYLRHIQHPTSISICLFYPCRPTEVPTGSPRKTNSSQRAGWRFREMLSAQLVKRGINSSNVLPTITINMPVVLQGRQAVSCTGELIFLLIYVSPVNFSFPGFKMGPYTEVNPEILGNLSKTRKKLTIRLGAFWSCSWYKKGVLWTGGETVYLQAGLACPQEQCQMEKPCPDACQSGDFYLNNSSRFFSPSYSGGGRRTWLWTELNKTSSIQILNMTPRNTHNKAFDERQTLQYKEDEGPCWSCQ